MASAESSIARFIDIGANLLDPMFQGIYHGKRKHHEDLLQVKQRAFASGVEKIIVTAGSLTEARDALALARTDPRLFCTVGVHPTRGDELLQGDDAKNYLGQLLKVAEEGSSSGHVVAIGECGLDFDRLQFCSKESQRRAFELQFELAEKTRLPMFLHNRNTGMEMFECLRRHRHRFTTGVVHTFDGTAEELARYLELGLYIGINGCSLKTEENLQVMAEVPLDRLMLETDAPWCEIKPTHAGARFLKPSPFASVKPEHRAADRAEECVKNRSEPCHIARVLEVVAGYRGLSPAAVAQHAYANANKVFFEGKGGGSTAASS